MYPKVRLNHLKVKFMCLSFFKATPERREFYRDDKIAQREYWLNRRLIGLILQPQPTERDWRIITEYGEGASAPTLCEAKRLAADFLLLDYAA